MSRMGGPGGRGSVGKFGTVKNCGLWHYKDSTRIQEIRSSSLSLCCSGLDK